MHFLGIPKFNEDTQWDKNNLLQDWIAFLKNPESKEVIMVSEYVKEIEEFQEILHHASADKETRNFFESRMKWIRDQISIINHERREGKQEGKLEKAREDALDMFLNMNESEIVLLGNPDELKKLHNIPSFLFLKLRN